MSVLISEVPCALSVYHTKKHNVGVWAWCIEESGREVWKMDSVITNVGWGTRGGLYSSLFFLFICFRDPLSPKAHYFPSSHLYASTFHSTHSLVFWVNPLAVTLYRRLLIELAFSNKILTSARNRKPRSKDHIRFIQNLSTSIYGYVLRHFSLSYSVDLKGSMYRWDLHTGQKRPLD